MLPVVNIRLNVLGTKVYNRRYAGHMDILGRIFKAVKNAREVRKHSLR